MVDHTPTAAERARTVLAAASSLTITAGERRAHLSGRHEVDARGRLSIDVPAGSGLPAVVDEAGEAPALVELTDIAPVAMRRRVRAHLTIAGWLSSAGAAAQPARLRFEPIAARLAEGPAGTVTDVDGEALAGAAPDPLAGAEAGLLCHLAHAHRDTVDRLTRLLPAARLYGACAVFPLRLDRYGIVLRLEDARGDRDVRLPFRTPARTPADVAAGVLDLLHRARGCRRRPLTHLPRGRHAQEAPRSRSGPTGVADGPAS